jgi:hypothetical protein
VALEMIGPIPGTVIKRSQASSFLTSAPDFLGDIVDPGVELLTVLRQIFDHVRHSGCQDIATVRQNVRQRMAQEPDPLPHGNPALQKERTDLVDDGRSVTDQTGANPMQGLQVKLLDALGGYKAHGRALHRLGYRFRIPEVVLMALDERLHELRRDKLRVMAQRQELPAEMMGSDASLHPDQAWRHVRQPDLYLAARVFLSQNDLAAPIHADQVERVLANVDANRGDTLLCCMCVHRMAPSASNHPRLRASLRSTAAPSH